MNRRILSLPLLLSALMAGCDSKSDNSTYSPENQANLSPMSPAVDHEFVEVEWFGADINKSSCLKTTSPAERIREIQSYGKYAKANDLPGGIVEVGSDTQAGFEYWTFYPSMEACVAALPRSQPIPSKYE